MNAGGAAAAPGCPPLFPAIADVQGFTFYTDKKHSVIDPALRAADTAAKKPLVDFQNLVLSQSDAYLQSRGRNTAAARCTIAQLDGWAKAGALTGKFNYQGANDRQWALTAISIAYLNVRDAPGLDAGQVARIQDWIGRLGYLVRKPYEAMRIQNNLFYWGALACIVSGAAAKDDALFQWGVGATRTGLASIQGNGVLPLELERGGRALNYHIFALTALEASAHFAQAGGANLYAENGGALDRLEDLVLRGMKDPAIFAQMTGATQEWPGEKAATVAWMEAAYARRHDSRLVPYLKRARPVSYPFFGDVTLLFGAPLP